MLRTLLLIACLALFSSCTWCKSQFADPPYSCVNIIDNDGFATTIRSKERLKQYACVNFEAPQPYQKVLRVYQRTPNGDRHSVVTSYYPNSQLKQSLEILNGQAHGRYREWYENGTFKLDCYVVGGIADITPEAQDSWLFDGTCSAWDECGNLIAQFQYCKGKLHGEGMKYHANGNIATIIPYESGRIQGCLRRYHSDGELEEEAEFRDSLHHGQARSYWPNGSIASEEEYRKGKLLKGSYYDINHISIAGIENGNGLRPLFVKNGLYKIEEYKLGDPKGIVQEFDEDGHLKKTYHVAEEFREGEERFYFAKELDLPPPDLNTLPVDDSPLQLKMTLEWHKDQLQGISRTWYANGQMESQREMADNMRNGISTAWYKDGSLMLIEEYHNDKLVKGQYFKRGDRVPESILAEGTGTVILYDENGKLLRRVCYYQGSPLDY